MNGMENFQIRNMIYIPLSLFFSYFIALTFFLKGIVF